MNINLGCRFKKLPNFTNVDVVEKYKPDVIDNALTLSTFANESADLIYACHILEHFSYEETKIALKRWKEVLKPKGILRISVPDLEKVFGHYFLYKDLDVMMHMLYGGQLNEFDFHKNGWDEIKLTEELIKIGFSDVYKWRWQDTEPHKYCDDYSQCYWPHMDKDNGVLLSLNLEAVK